MVLRRLKTYVAGDQLLTKKKKRISSCCLVHEDGLMAGCTWVIGVSRQEVQTRESWLQRRSCLAELNINMVLRTCLQRVASRLRV